MELELLHHYTTSTCYTISRHPVVQTIFRINVPQLGFTSQFVMHALLAISALHIARFKPEHEAAYFSRAIVFHEMAMRDVARILPHVTQDNCAALYVFSVLTCVIPCAKPRRGRDFLLMGDGGISEWLIAFRGTRSIVESASEMLLNSPIAAIFSDGVRKTQRREAFTAKKHPYLLNLYQLLDEATTSQEILETYKSAVDELCKSFEAVFEPAMQGFESSDVFFWLFRVSGDYLTLLAAREPLALIIFAHFCVLLKQLEWTWWMEGWSNHLLFRIYNSVCSEYRPWLQWPIEQIGWVPQDVRDPQNSLMMDAARQPRYSSQNVMST